MTDAVFGIIAIIVLIALIIGFAIGAVKTFQRNWIAAIFLLIFLAPIWIIWAFVEIFTGSISSGSMIGSFDQPTQSVNVTVINRISGSSEEGNNSDSGSVRYELLNSSSGEPRVDDKIGTLTVELSEMKQCPYCAEKIRNEAIYCRYCKREI